jgi:hypothetical protein
MNANGSFCDPYGCHSMWLQLISNMHQDLWKAHFQISDLHNGITLHHDLLNDCLFRLYTKDCEMAFQAQEHDTIMYRESMKTMHRSRFRDLAAIQFHVEHAINECTHDNKYF